MLTLIVHRDADFRRQFVRLWADVHEDETDALHDVASVNDAFNLDSYDVVMFDLVDIAGKVWDIGSQAAPILCNYLRFHRQTRIVLHYTVGRSIAEDVVDQVKETYPDANIVLLDCMAAIDSSVVHS